MRSIVEKVTLFFSWDLMMPTPRYLSKRLFRKYLLSAAPFLKGRLLDVGCGQKPFKRFLEVEEYVSLDDDVSVNPDIVASASELPIDDTSFDSVLCAEVLEHVPEPLVALSECYRVLKDGGYAYVTVPMMWYLHYEPHDYYRFTNHGIRYLAEKAGFEVVWIKKLGGFWLFLFLRGAEVLWVLMKGMCLPFRFFNKTRYLYERLPLILLAPYHVVTLVCVWALDWCSKRDARGWAVLLKKAGRAS